MNVTPSVSEGPGSAGGATPKPPGASLTLGVTALITIGLLLFAKPLIKNEVLTLRDHSDYFQPLRLFTCQELRRGFLPLWNPYSASGEPWLANPQTGVFYPPTWLFIVVPFARAYTLFLAFHVALLGYGAFLLFRRFASDAAAFLGALTLMLCGPSLSLLDVSNTLATFAWIPLVLWCALAMAPAAWCALAIAMSFLAGEPFFAALGGLLFIIIRRENIIRIALTAFGLSAIQLLPFLALVSGSDREGHVEASDILHDSLPLTDWIHVFFWGTSKQQFIPVVGVGIIGSVLALIAVATQFRRREVLFAVIVLVISAIIATGSYIPPVGFALVHLPIVLLRYPARMLTIAALAIAALSAIGFDGVASRVRFRWLPILLAALIIIDLTPRIAPLMASAPFNPHPTPYAPGLARDSKFVRLLRGRNFDRTAWLGGYLNLFDRRFDVWTAAPVVSESYARLYERGHFEEMSAGYFLSDRPLHLPAAARARNVTMYRDRNALPLAYWREGREIRPVTLLAFTSSAVHITVDAPRDGLVTVTQNDARGWRAIVDGAQTDTLPGDAFRTIAVKRGHHTIAWRYRPPSLIVGAMITLVAIFSLVPWKNFVKRSREKNFFAMRLQAR